MNNVTDFRQRSSTNPRIAMIWELIRFGFVGAGCAFAFAACARLLIDLQNFPVFAAAGASYVLVMPLSYVLHRIFTFRSTVAHTTTLPKYVVVSALATVISAVLPEALTNTLSLGLDVNHALMITCAVVPLFNYLVKSNWVFASHDKPQQ